MDTEGVDLKLYPNLFWDKENPKVAGRCNQEMMVESTQTWNSPISNKKNAVVIFLVFTKAQIFLQ